MLRLTTAPACEIDTIPSGKVTSYAAVARKIGRNRAALAVGNALHELSSKDPEVPRWRVLRKTRMIPHPHAHSIRPVFPKEWRVILEREGVEFDGDGRIAEKHFCEDW
ncbi:MAG: MGMT family protein [Gammaproteobacteria bacterium]|nr:MGMT family protein [Gammaproteobacteria bacterium]MDE0258033.1 MGMT family protein [Gammaproteobacteria bacterium]